MSYDVIQLEDALRDIDERIGALEAMQMATARLVVGIAQQLPRLCVDDPEAFEILRVTLEAWREAFTEDDHGEEAERSTSDQA